MAPELAKLRLVAERFPRGVTFEVGDFLFACARAFYCDVFSACLRTQQSAGQRGRRSSRSTSVGRVNTRPIGVAVCSRTIAIEISKALTFTFAIARGPRAAERLFSRCAARSSVDSDDERQPALDRLNGERGDIDDGDESFGHGDSNSDGANADDAARRSSRRVAAAGCWRQRHKHAAAAAAAVAAANAALSKSLARALSQSSRS